MPITYKGVPASFTAGTRVTTQVPVDGDPDNAATFASIQGLADVGAYILDKLIGVSVSSWQKVNATVFAGGGAQGALAGTAAYVAVGASGILSTSTDGQVWTTQTSNTAADLRSAAYGAGLWVACGGTAVPAGQFTTSPNGTTWTARASAVAQIVSQVLYCPFATPQWVAVGGSVNIQRSPDGFTWSLANNAIFAGNAIGGLAYGNGTVVVAGGTAGPFLASSTDGITFTPRTPPVTVPALTSLSFVCYGGGQFIAADTNTPATVLSSPDGITWTKIGVAPSAIQSQPVWNGTCYVALAGIGLWPNITAYTSMDGITWRTRPTNVLTGSGFANGSLAVSPTGAIVSFGGPSGIQVSLPLPT